jgi:hypothetical protein
MSYTKYEALVCRYCKKYVDITEGDFIKLDDSVDTHCTGSLKNKLSLRATDVSFLYTDNAIITFETLCQGVTPFQNPQTFIMFLRQTSTLAIFKIKIT